MMFPWYGCFMFIGIVCALILTFSIAMWTVYRRDFSIGSETYTMDRILGVGTEGVVFAAQRVQDQTRVALKWKWNPVRLSCDSFLVSFLPDHPHLVPVLDIGRDSITGASWIVFGFCPGVSFSDWIFTHSPDPTTLRRVLCDIGSGLVSLHARGLVHRDVIPKNIIVDPESNHALLCDYGRMRRLRNDGTIPQTHGVSRCDYRDVLSEPDRTTILESTGAKRFTNFYAPPERFDASLIHNETFDTWMWTCTLIFALTGRTNPYRDGRSDVRRRLSVRDTFVRTRSWESWTEWKERYLRSYPALFDLLQHAFSYDPRNRWNVRTCLSHPWFTTESFP